jgi:hypothetical protein
MALAIRTSRSWMSRMTWVPVWVRPMPMWRSWPWTRQGHGSGFVDAVVADAVVGLGVAGGSGDGFGHRAEEGCGGGSVREGAVRSVLVVGGDEPVEQVR